MRVFWKKREKNDRAERARGLGKKKEEEKREEIRKENPVTALRFQAGGSNIPSLSSEVWEYVLK